LALMIGVNLLFVAMNIAALRKGLFQFSKPDALGMPLFEFVMWGFYTLHTIRMLCGATPEGSRRLPVIMAVVFALPFCTIGGARELTLVSGTVVAASLVVFHEPMDLAYAGYMALLGAAVEYIGVGTGQWWYPGSPAGGVPLWFVTMWAGIGLFTRRLLLPLVRHGAETSVPGQLPTSCGIGQPPPTLG